MRSRSNRVRCVRSKKSVTIFSAKKMFCEHVSHNRVFHVVSKVLGTICKMDILKMSVFLYKKRSPIVINNAHNHTIISKTYLTYRKVSFCYHFRKCPFLKMPGFVRRCPSIFHDLNEIFSADH